MRPLSVAHRVSFALDAIDMELIPPDSSVLETWTTLFSGVKVNEAKVPLPAPTKNLFSLIYLIDYTPKAATVT